MGLTALESTNHSPETFPCILLSELQKTLANFIAADPTVQHNRTRSLERSPTGLTPESKRQRFTSANPSLNEKKASKTRKALFENVNYAPGDYSSLNDEILNLMNIQTDTPGEGRIFIV